ncbi:MAG: 5'-nucleotidase C-terminal domain-containing protein, partial [Gemmatimonadetes bacterium]|nr:5'-nucleotidase C-terminal domain-containing protein [Gemmatimonadota bacterium]
MELVLLGTTDVHGRVYPYDYYTGQPTDHGLTLLKPLVDSIRAANPGRVYLFDSGDLLQGTLLAYLYARVRSQEPSPIVRAMNLMGYSASAIGNHEFNYGLEYLGRAVAQAAFPLVTANVYRHGTGEHAYRPYVLLPHPVAGGDTIRLGVTGVTPPGVHIWDRRHVEGVLDFRDAVASLRPVVAEMRARGADLVVVLSHGGFGPTSYDTVSTGLARENAAREIAREVAGVDVVFLGHTHREIADTTINGVLLTQARNWAQSLAVVTVRLEREPGSPRGEAAWGKGGSPRGGAAREGQPGAWRVAAKRAAILRPRRERADTALLDSLRREHERAAVFARSVIGRSTEAMDARAARVRDTPILDFVNEVQRRVAGADLSSTAAFRLAARIPQGDVTIGDIGGLYIYDNQLLAVRITGAQLRAYLEKTAEYY